MTGYINLMTWGFGICATGFFFLALWIRQIADRLLLNEIREIKQALIGDLNKPGVLTIIQRHDEQIRCIVVNCEKRHSPK